MATVYPCLDSCRLSGWQPLDCSGWLKRQRQREDHKRSLHSTDRCCEPVVGACDADYQPSSRQCSYCRLNRHCRASQNHTNHGACTQLLALPNSAYPADAALSVGSNELLSGPTCCAAGGCTREESWKKSPMSGNVSQWLTPTHSAIIQINTLFKSTQRVPVRVWQHITRLKNMNHRLRRYTLARVCGKGILTGKKRMVPRGPADMFAVPRGRLFGTAVAAVRP